MNQDSEPRPNPVDPDYARALLSGTHSIDAVTSEFATTPEETIDLNGIPRDQLALHECANVLPTPAITRYLASGDTLTHEAINKMELALEEHYHLEHPWYITSERVGEEDDEDLHIKHFVLMREVEEDVSRVPLAYLNRLGDLLYVFARRANQLAEKAEEPWTPPSREV